MAKAKKKTDGKIKSSKKKDDQETTTQELTGQAWEKGKSVKCAPDESEQPEEVDENEED